MGNPSNISKANQRVLSAYNSLRHLGPPSIRDLAQECGIALSTTHRNLSQLRARGYNLPTRGQNGLIALPGDVVRFAKEFSNVFLTVAPQVQEALLGDLYSSLEKARSLC